MSTRYYLTRTCPACGHQDHHLLGHSALGWKFELYARHPKDSARALWLWTAVMVAKGYSIRSEAGAELSHNQFWLMVDRHQEQPLSASKERPGDPRVFRDSQNYELSLWG
jgi:hypothetical protein